MGCNFSKFMYLYWFRAYRGGWRNYTPFGHKKWRIKTRFFLWDDGKMVITFIATGSRSAFLGPLCCRSVTFWYGSGSADPYHCLTDPYQDSDPAPDPAQDPGQHSQGQGFVDPWHLGTDPDPRIRTTDLQIGIRIGIRLWVLLRIRISIPKATVVDLWHFGTDSDIQIRTTDLRIRIHIRIRIQIWNPNPESESGIRIRNPNPESESGIRIRNPNQDPDPQIWLNLDPKHCFFWWNNYFSRKHDKQCL
jgi:hypothetical protein